MSDDDSSTEGSLPLLSPRILGSRLRSNEKEVFVQDCWHDLLGTCTQDGTYKSIRGPAQQKPARLKVMDSDESSATRRSPISFIQGIELHPFGDHVAETQSASHSRRVPSPSSQVPSHTRMASHGNSFELCNSVIENSSPTYLQLQRPPSPRSQITKSQANHRFIQTNSYPSSMDKFILPQNEPAELRPATLNEWRKLRSLRAKALRQRSQLHNLRKDLQEKQVAKGMADENFMKCVRSNRSAPTEPSPLIPFTSELDLDACYDAMQATRDEYGEAEFEYSSLEDALGDTEYELVMLEAHFYDPSGDNNLQSQVQESAQQVSGGITSSAPTSLLGISSDHEEEDEYHPLKFDYLSKLGDLDLAKERYHNMMLERDKLLSNQISRLHLGIELQDNEKVFLAEFPVQEAALRGEIAALEEDVERLKAKCLTEGIDVSESNEPSDAGTSRTDNSDIKRDSVHDSGSFHEIGTIQSLKTESSYSMFSLLLPKSIKGKATLDILITDFDEYKKGDRLNR